jgi:hypothetical protein
VEEHHLGTPTLVMFKTEKCPKPFIFIATPYYNITCSILFYLLFGSLEELILANLARSQLENSLSQGFRFTLHRSTRKVSAGKSIETWLRFPHQPIIMNGENPQNQNSKQQLQQSLL